MDTISIAGTDLNVSPIVLGTGSYYSDVPDNVADRLLSRYLDMGGNLLDTANYYGRWAMGCKPLSELGIGRWLKRTGNRGRILLATKGVCYEVNRPDRPRVTPKHLQQDLEESLRNLQTDYLDLYWLHQDDPTQPVEPLLDMLNDYVRKGKIRAFGCSNWSPTRMEAADRYARCKNMPGFIASQVMFNAAVPNMEALHELKQSWAEEEHQSYYAKTGMPLFAYTAQAGGFFTAVHQEDFLMNPAYANVRKYFLNQPNLERGRRIRMLAERHGCSATAICLAFLRAQPFRVFAIAGPHTEAQFEDTMQGVGVRITSEELAYITVAPEGEDECAHV